MLGRLQGVADLSFFSTRLQARGASGAGAHLPRGGGHSCRVAAMVMRHHGMGIVQVAGGSGWRSAASTALAMMSERRRWTPAHEQIRRRRRFVRSQVSRNVGMRSHNPNESQSLSAHQAKNKPRGASGARKRRPSPPRRTALLARPKCLVSGRGPSGSRLCGSPCTQVFYVAIPPRA